MNSTHTPNTPTNTLESIGGVPETLAVTNILKTKYFKKYTESPVSGKATCTWPKPKIQKMSQQQTSVSVGETSPDAANDYLILPNHARSNSRANGGVGGDVHALFSRPPIFHIFGNFRKSCPARTYENQGTQGSFLALECKCAFGAKSFRRLI